VRSRLLRTEARAGNTYYELSHDALLEPVLASQRLRALVTGWLQAGLAGSVVISIGGLVLWIPEFVWSDPSEKRLIGGVVILLCPALLVGKVAWSAVHRGLSRVRRFAERNDTELGWKRVSRSERQRGMVLIWAGLTALAIFGSCFLLLVVGLVLRASRGGAAMGMEPTLGWGNGSAVWGGIVALVLAPLLAVEWCRAGLRLLLGASDLPQSGAWPTARSWARLPLGLAAAASACVTLPFLLFQVRCSLLVTHVLPESFLASWVETLGYQCSSSQRGPNAALLVIGFVVLGLIVAASVYFLRRPTPARPSVA
jgi:hypothetical protein